MRKLLVCAGMIYALSVTAAAQDAQPPSMQPAPHPNQALPFRFKSEGRTLGNLRRLSIPASQSLLGQTFHRTVTL